MTRCRRARCWRLGRLSECDDQVRWWGDRPKDAARAVTMLNTSLMPVEVAASVFLDASDAETLQCIGYLFLPDHW